MQSIERGVTRMKNFLFAATGIVALGLVSPATAADLPVAPVKAPPPIIVPIYDWSGFYIGANGGWGESRNCWGFVTIAGATLADGCSSGSGGVFGGQIGYRWQMGQFVFGFEGQGNWADLKSFRVSTVNPTFSTSTTVDGLGLITGQLGYAVNAALFYLRGGAAVVGNRYDVSTTVGGVNVASASSTRWGGAVGVGFEYGFAPNWSVGIEYDRLFMGDANSSFSVTNPVVAGALNRIGQDVDLVTIRFNYRFGGPVVARY
jgi:outer membrane immunogenic protein